VKVFIAVLFCLFSPAVTFAKKKEVAQAPLPTIVQSAKTAFLTNGGGEGAPLAFDEFYSQIKQWGRFQLAASPAQADIVIELRYVVEDKGTHVWSSTNTYTNQTQVYSAQVTDPQLILSIYEPKSGTLLWSTTDHRKLARFSSNRAKETVNSADRLVRDLQNRIGDQNPDSLQVSADKKLAPSQEVKAESLTESDIAKLSDEDKVAIFATRFMHHHPEYIACPENSKLLTSYMQTHVKTGLPMESDFEQAYQALKPTGLLTLKR